MRHALTALVGAVLVAIVGADELNYWPNHVRLKWDGCGFDAWMNEHGDLVPYYDPRPTLPTDPKQIRSGPGPLFSPPHLGVIDRDLLEYRSGMLIPGALEALVATPPRRGFLPTIGGTVIDLASHDHKKSSARIFNLPGSIYLDGMKRRGKETLDALDDDARYPEQGEEYFLNKAATLPKVYAIRYGKRWFFGTKSAAGEFTPHAFLYPRKERPTAERIVDFIPKELEGKEAYEHRSGRLILGRIERVGDAGQRVFIPKLGSKIIAAKSDEVRKDVPVYNQPD